LLLIGFAIPAQSQIKSDTSAVRLLKRKCNEAHNRAPDSVILYAQQGYEMALSINDKKGQGEMLSEMGIYYWLKGESDKAIVKYKEANDIYTEIDFKEGYAGNLGNMGMIYSKLGDYPKAIDLFLQSLKYLESTSNNLKTGRIYNSLGVVYKNIKQYKESLSAYRKAYQLFEIVNSKTDQAGTLINIGNIYEITDSVELSLEYINRALIIFNSSKIIRGQIVCYNNISNLLSQKNKPDSAIVYGQKALELSQKHGFSNNEVKAYAALAKAYESAKNYAKAETYYKNSISKALEINDRVFLVNLYNDMALMNRFQGKHVSAIDYFIKYDSLRNLTFSEESDKKIADLRIAFDIEKNEREITLLKKDVEIEKLRRLMLIVVSSAIAIIFALIIARLYLKIKKGAALREQQNKLHVTQQQLLEAEIQNKELREKEMELELELRDKELASRALNLIQKNEMLEEVKDRLKELDKTASDSNIQNLIRNIQFSFKQDKEWEGFMEHFEKVHTSFFNNLNMHYPELTSNDLKLCSLIKLNLETKQMASILGISVESVKVARHRLRKKLGLEPEQSLLASFATMETKLREN